SEVRTLAQRSATAASEIKGLIGASVAEVGVGSALVQQAGAAMAGIVTSIGQVSTIINEINIAGAEQSQGIDQVNQAVIGMDNVTQQNAALVEQAAAAAMSLQEQASALRQAVEAFRTQAGAQANVVPAVSVAARVAAKPALKAKAVPRRAAKPKAAGRNAAEPIAQTGAATAAPASAKEQQRERTAAAAETKAAASAPKLPVPKLVAAGGDDSDWETF
ncbi:MAG: hypothetical protein I4O48_07295, partial [Ralstonia sp.]|nr:hypothetical protein [Ralstonia sp.]